MGPIKLHSAKSFDPLMDISDQNYAKILFKYACTIELSQDYEEESFANCGPDYRYGIVKGPGSRDWVGPSELVIVELKKNFKCADSLFDDEKDFIHVVEAKHCKMVTKKQIPLEIPEIHKDEKAWANSFPSCWEMFVLESFDPKTDLIPENYAKLLYKYACTVEFSDDCPEEKRVGCRHAIVKGPGPYNNVGPTEIVLVDLLKNEPCFDIFDDGDLSKHIPYVVEAKYCKMLARRPSPREVRKIHEEEKAWANSFPTCSEILRRGSTDC